MVEAKRSNSNKKGLKLNDKKKKKWFKKKKPTQLQYYHELLEKVRQAHGNLMLIYREEKLN